MKTLMAAFLFFTAVPLYSAESPVAVRLAEVKGVVTARASSTAAWVDAKNGTMLAPGGEIKSEANGSAVLAFSDGNKVKFGPRTTFAVEGATTLTTSLRLFSGRLQAWIRRANKADFVVRHRAGVAAVRGTVFEMLGAGAGLKIVLFEGALDITDSFGRPSSLSPGQSAQMSETAGMQRIASLPPGVTAPAEPEVAIPAAPKIAAALPSALPASAPAEAPAVTAPPATSPAQEKVVAPVSPSTP